MTSPSDTPERSYDDTAPFIQSGAAGEVIFKEGDAATDLFIVQDGRVELLRAGASAPVGIAAEGDLVGEWSFFEQKPSDVTARSLTDFTLIRLDRAAFERVTGEAPETAVRMLQKLVRALHERRCTIAAASAAAAPSPPAPPEEAFLIEERTGTRFVLSDEEAQIGRVDRTSGVKPPIDLTPLDTERTLSRRHARILKRGDGYVVREDTASRNGTFVNGRRIDAGVDVPLKDGDELRFGLVKTIFRWH
jgi:CRP-like cAMP-binding protein